MTDTRSWRCTASAARRAIEALIELCDDPPRAGTAGLSEGSLRIGALTGEYRFDGEWLSVTLDREFASPEAGPVRQRLERICGSPAAIG